MEWERTEGEKGYESFAGAEIVSCCFISVSCGLIEKCIMLTVQILNLDMPIAEKSIKNKVIFYNAIM